MRHLIMNALGHADEQAFGQRDHEPALVESMRWPNKWFILRLAIIGFFASGGIFFPHPPDRIPWLILLFPFFAFFLLLYMRAWVSISRGGTRYVWRRPSWYANPFTSLFTKTQPLQFFHMGAFCFMALGVIALICGSWDWHHGAPLPLLPFCAGLGIWAFVRIFCLVFRKKMSFTSAAPEPPPRSSAPDVVDYRMVDSPRASGSGGGR
jgi:hypothetical protein